ncbi:unnamed protein product [Ambrosiozyma monospora]|uniref:Unnamed protein product n=1 Tax=Ambrosiozyma monospora TaxID=43982 RepID=A0ACB5SSZ4_AMBMO|nr:unnamed protein product [Ambrosiozyma monospora]
MNLTFNTLSYSSSETLEQEITKDKDQQDKSKSRSNSPESKDTKSQETKKSEDGSIDDSPVELFTPKAREGTTVTIAPAFEEVNNNNDELAELRGEGRYFGVADPEASQPVCSNCHRRGHIRAKCKVVVCHACGKVDDHYETQCPNSMVCSNCGKRGHFRGQCTERRQYNYCTTCDSRNHSSDRCPNIWRSYIVIDSGKKIGYPSGSIYCYNCAKQGHYGDECPSARTSKTPNINGSAFTGENLPKPLRAQYKTIYNRMMSEYGSYGFDVSSARESMFNSNKTGYNNGGDYNRKRSNNNDDGGSYSKRQRNGNDWIFANGTKEWWW